MYIFPQVHLNVRWRQRPLVNTILDALTFDLRSDILSTTWSKDQMHRHEFDVQILMGGHCRIAWLIWTRPCAFERALSTRFFRRLQFGAAMTKPHGPNRGTRYELMPTSRNFPTKHLKSYYVLCHMFQTQHCFIARPNRLELERPYQFKNRIVVGNVVSVKSSGVVKDIRG